MKRQAIPVLLAMGEVSTFARSRNGGWPSARAPHTLPGGASAAARRSSGRPRLSGSCLAHEPPRLAHEVAQLDAELARDWDDHGGASDHPGESTFGLPQGVRKVVELGSAF